MIFNWPWLLVSMTLTLSCTFSYHVSLALGEDTVDEDIEMLEIVEVPGTAVIRESRSLDFPTPDMMNMHASGPESLAPLPSKIQIDRSAPPVPIILDPVGKTRGIRSTVKPLKTERPPYPRFAREQGWHGTTVLRINIETNGTVSSVTTQKSSGFPILDGSANLAVKKWVFSPAKNGEFPVASTVDVPIRFDLDQPH